MPDTREERTGLLGSFLILGGGRRWTLNRLAGRGDIRDCLSSKEAALGLLYVIEKQVVGGGTSTRNYPCYCPG